MQRFLIVTAVIASAILAGTPADARVSENGTDSVVAEGGRGVWDAGSANNPLGGGGGPPPPPALHWNASGGACVTGMGGFAFSFAGGRGFISSCGGGGGAAARPSPAEAAYQAWHWQTKLPSPTLSTSPTGGAITGLDLYLSIGGPQALAFDIAALGYTIHLEVTSTYDVDWGDPRPSNENPLGYAVTKGHRTQGGPYPDGDLRHQYIERGTVTIAVIQRWTATWSGGGEAGTIAGRLSTTGTLSIPVQEIVAVARPVGANPFGP